MSQLGGKNHLPIAAALAATELQLVPGQLMQLAFLVLHVVLNAVNLLNPTLQAPDESSGRDESGCTL